MAESSYDSYPDDSGNQQWPQEAGLPSWTVEPPAQVRGGEIRAEDHSQLLDMLSRLIGIPSYETTQREGPASWLPGAISAGAAAVPAWAGAKNAMAAGGSLNPTMPGRLLANDVRGELPRNMTYKDIVDMLRLEVESDSGMRSQSAPLGRIINARERAGTNPTTGWPQTSQNPDLAPLLNQRPMPEADHYAHSQQEIMNSGPVAGRVEMAAKVPGYAAAKWLAQSDPRLGALLEQLLKKESGYLTEASAPSLSQMLAGWRPIFEKLPYQYSPKLSSKEQMLEVIAKNRNQRSNIRHN